MLKMSDADRQRDELNNSVEFVGKLMIPFLLQSSTISQSIFLFR